MKIKFFKYQGTGNDFIMIDGRQNPVNFSVDEISSLCDRKFGIGADGLIILKNHHELDFEMDYYNADGTQSFCGNGSRCAQAFAKKLGIIDKSSTFLAIDGIHEGKCLKSGFATKMADVSDFELLGQDYFINTGSPHYIVYLSSVEEMDFLKEAKKIRYSERFSKVGTNVNFVQESNSTLKVRTYERGVEGETLSCGTGVTAVAISYLLKTNKKVSEIELSTLGGNLQVELKRSGKTFNNIWLKGPALEVFSGQI